MDKAAWLIGEMKMKITIEFLCGADGVWDRLGLRRVLFLAYFTRGDSRARHRGTLANGEATRTLVRTDARIFLLREEKQTPKSNGDGGLLP